MKINCNIEKFHEQYEKEYDFLYDNKDRVAGFDESLECFDKLWSTNLSFQNFVKEFGWYREDPITSDREKSTFIFAMDNLVLLN